MQFTDKLKHTIQQAVRDLYDFEWTADQIQINETPEHFDGDFTVVTFPITKVARKPPHEIAAQLGEQLATQLPEIQAFNVVKGFLNLSLKDEAWFSMAGEKNTAPAGTVGTILVEYASPNTNKPLHLGHIRNILLGWSIHKILKAAGNKVITSQIINDRGIAIMKSMLAWLKYANGATPESTGIKGDHFVGDYYVLFAQKLAEEYAAWQQTDQAKQLFAQRRDKDQSREAFFKAFKDRYFNEYSSLGAEARELLRKWEQGDPETVARWKQMNQWVLDGFDVTYHMLGVSFDKTYFESDTYLLGKDIIAEGLRRGVFTRNDDGAVVIDLEDEGLGQKVVLRSDGTSLYITQDIGLAHQRYKEFHMDAVTYVVGSEQIYHFKALFAILKRLGEPYADKLHHLAYGMVDLTTGRMKSREGTVVDADDLIEDMIQTAKAESAQRNEISDLSPEKQHDIHRQIALGALKFFILKVNPMKRMVFNPEESIELQGQTGPYIQYAYVRAHGLRHKAPQLDLSDASQYKALRNEERDIIKRLVRYPDTVREAADKMDPSIIAAYAYNLAKAFNKFWHECPILTAPEPGAREFRFQLSTRVADRLREAMDLLGIEMPERM